MVHAGLSTWFFFLDHFTFLQPTSSHDHSDQTVVSAFTGFLHRKPVDCERQALTRRNGPCSWRFANSWHRSKFPKCRWRSKCRCNIRPLSLGMMWCMFGYGLYDSMWCVCSVCSEDIPRFQDQCPSSLLAMDDIRIYNDLHGFGSWLHFR